MLLIASRVTRKKSITPISLRIQDGVLQPLVLKEILCQSDVSNQLLDIPTYSADGIVNVTCRADEEGFYALSQELLKVINFTEINKVTNNITGRGSPADIYNQLSEVAGVIGQVIALTGGINENSSFLCGNQHDGDIPLALIGAAFKILRQALPQPKSDVEFKERTDDE